MDHKRISYVDKGRGRKSFSSSRRHLPSTILSWSMPPYSRVFFLAFTITPSLSRGRNQTLDKVFHPHRNAGGCDGSDD